MLGGRTSITAPTLISKISIHRWTTKAASSWYRSTSTIARATGDAGDVDLLGRLHHPVEELELLRLQGLEDPSPYPGQ